jgi:hypothetical protein
MNTSGNTARTQVGVATTRDTCNRVNNGQTLAIDIFEDQVASDRGLSGFQFVLNYDASKVHVTAVDYNQLLAQASGSTVIPFGDTTSSDGTAGLSALDFGKGIEPSGASEVGPGVLARVTLQGQAGTGVSNLTLTGVTATDDAGNIISVTNVLNAQVAANANCSGGGTATPTPTQVSSPPPGPTNTPTPTPTEAFQPTPTGTMTPTPTLTPTAPANLLGDMDCNGQVNTGDLSLLLKYVGGVPAATGCRNIGSVSGNAIKGDLNCDHRVDPRDALSLLLTIAVDDASGCSS